MMLVATLYTWQDPVALALVLSAVAVAVLRARGRAGACGGCRACPAAKLQSTPPRARR